MPLHEQSVRDLAATIRAGDVTPGEAVEHFLARIERLDDRVGAFTTVTAARSRERAERLQAAAPEGPLWGVPSADKDLVSRAGVRTQFGSRRFADHVARVTDPIANALDATGAVSLGKTNTSEFGVTGYTESAVAPPARDPWDLTRNAGGSSGGAAVAVAAGLLPFAIASDGGGSIRIPSATVGVVGLKPSRGRIPAASGLDSLAGLVVGGPITRNVRDAAAVLDAMAESQPFRHATRAVPSGPFLPTLDATTRGLRIAVTTTSPWDDAVDIALAPTAGAAIARASALLSDAGHDLSELDWTPRGYAVLFRTIWRASAARIPVHGEDLDLVEPITAWLVTQGRALDPERLLAALAAANVFERDTITAFSPYDVILTPALAQTPRPVGWYDREDAERNFEQQVQYSPFTSFVNVAGLPAITLPVMTSETGHPVSVQLIGGPGGEAAILAAAAQLEDAVGTWSAPGFD